MLSPHSLGKGFMALGPFFPLCVYWGRSMPIWGKDSCDVWSLDCKPLRGRSFQAYEAMHTVPKGLLESALSQEIQPLCAFNCRLDAWVDVLITLPEKSCRTSHTLSTIISQAEEPRNLDRIFFPIVLSFQQCSPEQIVSGGWQKFNNHSPLQLLMCTEEQVIKRAGYRSNPFLPIAHITIMMP